jgi:hypothetical protein
MERFLESFIASAGRVFPRARGLHGRPHLQPPKPVAAAVLGEPLVAAQSESSDPGQLMKEAAN